MRVHPVGVLIELFPKIESCAKQIEPDGTAAGDGISSVRFAVVFKPLLLGVEARYEIIVPAGGIAGGGFAGCSAISSATRPSPDCPFVVVTVKPPVGPPAFCVRSPETAARKLASASVKLQRRLREDGSEMVTPSPQEFSVTWKTATKRSPGVCVIIDGAVMLVPVPTAPLPLGAPGSIGVTVFTPEYQAITPSKKTWLAKFALPGSQL